MNFVLIGAAGYVAPRHMRAIKEVGGDLVAALDPHDSVGILDSYFPNCRFFTEFERFDRHCDKLIRSGTSIDWVSVASPNYLHDSHCRFGLRIGANVICEKPLVTKEHNLNALKALELETGKTVHTVLQLRTHPEAEKLKRAFGTSRPVDDINKSDLHDVHIDYITPRGAWYLHSWKGSLVKSGGLATNIGVHLFDLAVWLFGEHHSPIDIGINRPDTIAGNLYLKRANVKFHLSICDMRPRRQFYIDGEKFEFTDGFTDLHTEVYRRTLAGKGWGIEATREAIRITEAIRDITDPECKGKIFIPLKYGEKERVA